jgi:lipopolysaccharide/colanic/teichoic acid biosynthesis glycosyltransferase
MAKRAMDIGLGTVLALLALPVILALAVGVAFSLRTNPFFLQRRVGKGGRLIPMVKLRTLPPSTPRYATKYELAHIEIPRFARTLRRLHLDELPQLLLVPLGYMSLVGPRPEMPQQHRVADAWFAAERTRVRPGCTGLWQISEAAQRLIWESPEYDRYYLRASSTSLDVWILWQTVRVLVGRGQPLVLTDLEPQPTHSRVTVAA